MSDEVQFLFQNLSRMAEYTLSSISESWIASLVLNLLCYATVFVPGYLLIRYFKNSKYIERAGEFVFFYLSISNLSGMEGINIGGERLYYCK